MITLLMTCWVSSWHRAIRPERGEPGCGFIATRRRQLVASTP